MTTYKVEGYTPSSLYEFATRSGIHAGSMEKLNEFAIAIQEAVRRALAAKSDAGDGEGV